MYLFSSAEVTANFLTPCLSKKYFSPAFLAAPILLGLPASGSFLVAASAVPPLITFGIVPDLPVFPILGSVRTLEPGDGLESPCSLLLRPDCFGVVLFSALTLEPGETGAFFLGAKGARSFVASFSFALALISSNRFCLSAVLAMTAP